MLCGGLGELVRVRKEVSMEDCKVVRGVGFSSDGMQYVGKCTRGVVGVNEDRENSLNNRSECSGELK